MGLIDEVRDHDGEVLNEVVLPLMNVSRKMVNGKLNPYEPHQTQFFIKFSFNKKKILCDYIEIYNKEPFELLENPNV